jgi:hypothetical protein
LDFFFFLQWNVDNLWMKPCEVDHNWST